MHYATGDSTVGRGNGQTMHDEAGNGIAKKRTMRRQDEMDGSRNARRTAHDDKRYQRDATLGEQRRNGKMILTDRKCPADDARRDGSQDGTARERGGNY